ncbi:hypothetical protein ACOY6I_21245 [Enterobacter hormaechei]
MAITSVFQADDAGLIPADRRITSRRYLPVFLSYGYAKKEGDLSTGRWFSRIISESASIPDVTTCLSDDLLSTFL